MAAPGGAGDNFGPGAHIDPKWREAGPYYDQIVWGIGWFLKRVFDDPVHGPAIRAAMRHRHGWSYAEESYEDHPAGLLRVRYGTLVPQVGLLKWVASWFDRGFYAWIFPGIQIDSDGNFMVFGACYCVDPREDHGGHVVLSRYNGLPSVVQREAPEADFAHARNAVWHHLAKYLECYGLPPLPRSYEDG